MRKLSKLTLCALLLVITLARPAGTARTGATFPVIVVFSDSAPLDQFPGQYRPDERAAANPDAWNYLDPRVAGAVQALERQLGFRAENVYSAALQGFSARLTAAQIQALERIPWVSSVEADGVATISNQILPWGIQRIGADISSTKAGDGTGTVNNVNVYIIDTGVERTHPDLNVVNHVNFTGGGQNNDCNGHGTHVAGTVAAKDNTIAVVGVAPGAPITGVKVIGTLNPLLGGSCGGSGFVSWVIKGVDWVTNNAVLPAIANMSLRAAANDTLDTAVRKSAQKGVFYSVAAGNDSGDACNVSPARAGAGTNNGIMTVAATDQADQEPSWSNFGSCVDIWAPGVNILSTYLNGGTTTLSGTSMSSPHAGGTAALYLSSHIGALPANVEAQLKADGVWTTTFSKDGRPIQIVYAGKY